MQSVLNINTILCFWSLSVVLCFLLKTPSCLYFKRAYQSLEPVTVFRWPEIGTSSIDWAQLNRFYLKIETKSSLRNVMLWNINRTVFLDNNRTMNNVQKHNIYINAPSSQIFRTYLQQIELVKSELHTERKSMSYSVCPIQRWFLLEKARDPQAIKKIPIFHGTRRSITAFTRARRWSLHESDEPVHTAPSCFCKVHFLLIWHLRLGLPSDLFPSGFLTKILYAFLSFPIRAKCSAHLILLYLISLIISGEG
jgi:hypothetical protein